MFFLGDADTAHKKRTREKMRENEDGGNLPNGGADGAPVILLVLLTSQLDSTGVSQTKGFSISRSGDSRGPLTHRQPLRYESQPQNQLWNNPDCGIGTGFGGQTSKSCSLAWLAAKKISS